MNVADHGGSGLCGWLAFTENDVISRFRYILSHHNFNVCRGEGRERKGKKRLVEHPASRNSNNNHCYMRVDTRLSKELQHLKR